MLAVAKLSARLATTDTRRKLMRSDKRIFGKGALLVVFACLAFPCSGLTEPDTVAEFYKGRTITILIGFPAGGSYDTYARLAAAHLRSFIPGQPSIVVQSRPGGSGVGAVTYFSANAPKDGTMLGIFPETIAISQQTEPRVSKWNVRDFTYIGSFANSNGVFVVRKDAQALTIEQMRVTTVHVGCNGRTGASYINPVLLKAYAGLKFDIHCGYPGSNEISIALARGEIDVTAGAWTGWRNRAQLLDGTVRPVIQAGMDRHKELSNVPLMQELISDRKEAEVAEFLSSGSAIGRALIAPRAVPSGRIAALRAAFLAMTADEKFRTEIRRSGLELDPISGAELDRISTRILEAPTEIVQLAIELAK
jgi:tripartite-type tricarboxylate transporter receptor subunit TctC